ncbi:hypothetical protein M0D21_22015 [Aquimarina sp. D1M17]|uniref:hypothetical protein n=1 Tax=Aquimarina acroporae TaxID=2937283 RepID=UPI0020BE0D56|nr:hypothetical protein [Aquimarina acroporae]MCK8524270.1 hypothetical protein [Aquimarina acroporae]
MNMYNQSNLEYSLIKYFSGKATPEEEVFVEKWVSQSSDNTSYYQRFQRLWAQRIIL